jgi:hypothetical protein
MLVAAGLLVAGPALAEHATSVRIGTVNQRSANEGDVVTLGAIDVRSVKGTDTSVSIGSTGAASTIAVASINAPLKAEIGSTRVGRWDRGYKASIAQSAYNSGDVVTAGKIRVGKIAGVGSSISISSSGAVSAISVTAINGGGRRR